MRARAPFSRQSAGWWPHAVTAGRALGDLLAMLYELADARDLPEQAAGAGHDGRRQTASG